ncbi:YbaK/EbsC family protein [Microbacterium trichothecenolyticum]|uniref:Prolyl-tRNA editing enzyme YbaK/EbsC (Cys-tRNA(Pro) deacylase) n=1 Tax=Microbacterium trichothecenolyticum TaxID=69370 RepID=A0ABU0TU02_MICTR|nr:YbaK/EbsC family protein [Microbacterium trichothecenolyticum]MDQ1123143.1 prolyl-tRNA editing enzyme YbaK/EbsC (Cys-tRNA(Pro) deacylase) [Microbacterium trichothecenolyticum]
MSTLTFLPAAENPHLVAAPVAAAIATLDPVLATRIEVAAVDPALADTAAFCEAYGQGLDISANCIVVQGTRGDVTRTAACLALATTRLDVNGTVRRLLEARKATFAPMDDAVSQTGMEYGGITPLGIPSDWHLLIDARVAALPRVVVGAGIRGAKLFLPGGVLASLPGAQVIEDLAKPVV